MIAHPFATLSAAAAIASAPVASASDIGLETVTVQSTLLKERSARVVLDRTEIARAAALTLGDVLAELPGTKVQANSRGEQVFSLRGSDQRQVAVTLDGMPLAAWDGQPHLNTIPASAIGHVAVTHGPASVLQPANALFGAINILTRRPVTDEWVRSLMLGVGANARQSAEAFVGGRAAAHSFSATLSWYDIGGFEVGHEDRTRIGSDAQQGSALLTWSTAYGDEGDYAGITLLATGGEQGVPPELHVDQPRYWRYSHLHSTKLIWHGRHTSGRGAFEYSLYADQAGSCIDQYGDDTYAMVVDIEDGRDRSSGGRLVWTRPIGSDQQLSLGASLAHSGHLFRERAASMHFAEYSQVLSQLAAEWQSTIGPWSRLVGVAYQRVERTDTGPYAVAGALGAFAATSAVSYALSDRLAVDMRLARTTRFPSLRESYNGALGRFVPNPSLGPEKALMASVGLFGALARYEWEVSGFAARIDDGIERVSLPRGAFTRVNQSRSNVIGAEFALAGDLNARARLRLEGTFLRARADAGDGKPRHLEYRPAVNVGSELTVKLAQDWHTTASLRSISNEYGLDGTSSAPRRLPSYTVWDLGIERSLEMSTAGELSLQFLVENVSDELVLMQWGIPGPGRRWSVAARWSF
jgi:iron complex outermembrane receptor protein